MQKDRPYRKSIIPENAIRVFEGEIFDVYQWEQELYDGSHATFERLVRPDTVAVFPVMEDGTIFLIRDTQPARGTVLTAPTGRVEDGEIPEEAAARELLEETGLSIGKLTFWHSYQVTSKIDWNVYVFIAHGCKKTQEAHPEPSERIEPYPVSFDEMTQLITSGQVRGNGFLERIFLEARHDSKKTEELKDRFFSKTVEKPV